MEKINHRKLRSTLGSRVSRRVGTKSRKQNKESVKIQMKRLVKAELLKSENQFNKDHDSDSDDVLGFQN